MWELMNEQEQEQIKQTRVYKDEIDWLKEAEARAVEALVKHHQEERKDLMQAWRKADKDRRQIMSRVYKRMVTARKRRQLARIERIKLKRKPAGFNIMKKPAREP